LLFWQQQFLINHPLEHNTFIRYRQEHHTSFDDTNNRDNKNIAKKSIFLLARITVREIQFIIDA